MRAHARTYTLKTVAPLLATARTHPPWTLSHARSARCRPGLSPTHTPGYAWAPLAGSDRERLAGAVSSCLTLSPYRAGEVLLVSSTYGLSVAALGTTLTALPATPITSAGSLAIRSGGAPPGAGVAAVPRLLLLGQGGSCPGQWEEVALPDGECGGMACAIGLILKHHSLVVGGSPAGRVVLCERGQRGAAGDTARALCTLPGGILSMAAEEGGGAPSAALPPTLPSS